MDNSLVIKVMSIAIKWSLLGCLKVAFIMGLSCVEWVELNG